jgi:hypothetical protein
VRTAFEAQKILEINGWGYSSTETTTLNNIFGEEQELGQIGNFDLSPISWKRSLMTLG